MYLAKDGFLFLFSTIVVSLPSPVRYVLRRIISISFRHYDNCLLILKGSENGKSVIDKREQKNVVLLACFVSVCIYAR